MQQKTSQNLGDTLYAMHPASWNWPQEPNVLDQVLDAVAEKME